MGANGTVIANAKSKIAATASANRRCLGVGGKVANDTFGSSDASAPQPKKTASAFGASETFQRQPTCRANCARIIVTEQRAMYYIPPALVSWETEQYDGGTAS